MSRRPNMNVRAGRREDFDAVMDAATFSFREQQPAHPDFRDFAPDTIRAATMPQWLLAERGGTLVGGLQIVPRNLIGPVGVRVRAAGIANVFCLPAFRGQGAMSRLLSASREAMARSGVVLSVLGGDRLRYGRFGWEVAGSVAQLCLSRRMRRGDDTPVLPMETFRAWSGGPDDIALTREAYERMPCRCSRTRRDLARVFTRPGVVVWMYRTPAGAAYVAVRGDRMAEYAGEAGVLEALVQALVQRRDWTAQAPTFDTGDACLPMLLRYASRYDVAPLGMLALVDLPALLAAYRDVLRQRLGAVTGARALTVAGQDQAVTVGGDTVVARGATPGAEVVRLTAAQATRLLFGPFCEVAQAVTDPVLRAAFPLPLFLDELDHV